MIKVERLDFKDIPQLLELYKELVNCENNVEDAMNQYKEMLQDKNYYLVGAKRGDELLGSMLGVCCNSLSMKGDPFLVVEDVVVKENTRGLGVGRMLMDELDCFAKARKCAYAIVVSSDYRETAHKFYEKVGFVDGVLGFRKIYK